MVLGSLTFGGGLALGLASSLHCAGMCGPIATSLMFGFGPNQRRALFAAQAGRVLVYIAAGALVGRAGGALYGAFDHPAAFLAMRAAAALSLGWIGFSLLGLAPSLAGLDRARGARRPGGGGAARAGRAAARLPPGWCGAFCRAGWFTARCSMRAVGRSLLAGAAVMAGFGLGTLPSVTAVALGLSRFRALAHAPRARVAVGLGLMAIAAASLAAPAVASGVFCLP